MSAADGAFYVFYSIHLVAHAYAKTEVGLLWSLGVVAEIVVSHVHGAPRQAVLVASHIAGLFCGGCRALSLDGVGC